MSFDTAFDHYLPDIGVRLSSNDICANCMPAIQLLLAGYLTIAYGEKFLL